MKKYNEFEIEELLSGSDEAREALFADAREARAQHFGAGVFLYGFTYYSTYCQNNCEFCYYRRDNSIERYRKTPDEVLAAADQLVKSGVSLIDLTTGTDRSMYVTSYRELISLTAQIKSEVGVPVMVSPGLISRVTYRKLAAAGADFLALYQETHNRALFSRLRAGQDFDDRFAAKKFAHQAGILVEEGIMTGVGETTHDIEVSLLQMGRIGADQMRVMSFEPQKGTPMEQYPPGDRTRELVVTALMRLMYPDRLIPASLDVDGIAGLTARLNAGANVITSIIPPHLGYRGVAHGELDIDRGARTAEEATSVLTQLGLHRADTTDLLAYIKQRKELL